MSIDGVHVASRAGEHANGPTSQRPARPQPADFNTLMHDLKGVSAMLWFVATSSDLKENGGVDFLHWLSRYLGEFHDDLFIALERDDREHGKVVTRG